MHITPLDLNPHLDLVPAVLLPASPPSTPEPAPAPCLDRRERKQLIQPDFPPCPFESICILRAILHSARGNTFTNVKPALAQSAYEEALALQEDLEQQLKKHSNDKDFLRLELAISKCRSERSKLAAELKQHLKAQQDIRYNSDCGLSDTLLAALPAESPTHWILVDDKRTWVWISATQKYIAFVPHLCPPQVTKAVYRLSNLAGPLSAAQIAAASKEQQSIEARIEKARGIHDEKQPLLDAC